MYYKKLGNSDLKVSVISFGCWQFEKSWSEDYNVDELKKTAEYAIEKGINFFDTAAAYGNGESETLLGEIIKNKRSKIIVATKVLAKSYDKQYLLKMLNASLERLNIDYVDIYQIHWPKRPFTKEMGEELISSFKYLREIGKIRYGGISNFQGDEIKYCDDNIIISNQVPYNLFWRYIEDKDIDMCKKYYKSILTYSPLAQGFLAGKFISGGPLPTSHRASLRFTNPKNYDFIMNKIEQLRELAKKYQISMARLSICWLLSNQKVDSVICGMRNKKQLDEILSALDFKMDEKLKEKVDKITLPIKKMFDGSPQLWEGNYPIL